MSFSIERYKTSTSKFKWFYKTKKVLRVFNYMEVANLVFFGEGLRIVNVSVTLLNNWSFLCLYYCQSHHSPFYYNYTI